MLVLALELGQYDNPTPQTAPEFDIHDYKTQNTFDHVIPKCENATAGQLCY